MAKLLYQPYKYLVYIPLLGLVTFILGICAITLSVLAGPRVGGIIGVLWARVLYTIIPATVTVTGKENRDKKQSYVVVANHLSLLDIFVLYGWLGLDLRWVMKVELRKVPVIGIASHYLGHIYIDRANRRSAAASLNDAREKLVNGTSVLFFPEGTRSRTNQMLPFKKGAFVVAKEMQLPILPVSILNTNSILPSDGIDLFPGSSRVIIHPPLTAREVSGLSVDEAMDRCQNIIASAL